MKKQTFVLWALTGMLAVPASAQVDYKTRAIVAEPENVPVAKRLSVWSAESAEYGYPVGLRNLGMISQDDNACCNFLSFNKVINRDAYMWAPMGETVSYIDNSSVQAVDYHWFIPGADATELETQDADAVYNTSGIYPFPTMTVKDGAGQTYTYTAPGKLKVGGKGEICTSNMLQLGTDINDPSTTAVIAHRPFNNGSGFLGGTNNLNIVGYGNLFMIAHPEADITAVNVYLPKIPKHKPGASLRMQIWYPYAGETDFVFANGFPLEVVELPMDEIRMTADTPLKSVAVAEFKLSAPLQIWDKPFFFVSIDGFSDDPTTEDFCMYMDIKPVEMDESTVSNLLAHNSYCKMKGEADYQHPVHQFATMPGESFMICPVIDTHTEEGVGIHGVEALKPAQAQYEDGVLSLSSEGAEQAVVYNVGGEKVVNAALDNGQADVHVHLAKGIYLVRFMKGGKVSGAAKLLCNE